MTQMLELPNQKFKTTVINMLMALKGKVDRIKNRDRQGKQSNGNPQKKTKNNGKDQKYNRNKEYL